MANAWWSNRPPHDYVFDVSSGILEGPLCASDAIVAGLRAVESRIQITGFRRGVERAIFEDALRDHYGDGAMRRYARVVKRCGVRRARSLYRSRLDPLVILFEDRWLPDAYLVDASDGVVVCYEVEDTHHLNRHKIRGYGRLWFALDEMGWDLHLITYDAYGNPRICGFPETDIVANFRSGPRQLRTIDELTF